MLSERVAQPHCRKRQLNMFKLKAHFTPISPKICREAPNDFRMENNGLGAKSENLSSIAPPGKRNSIDIMC